MTQPPEYPPGPPYPQQPYPQAGQQPPPPYGQPWMPPVPSQPPPSTNGLAIAALIFGIVPVCFLGVVFGFVSLRQIKRTGQSGRGLAISGIVLSGLWAVGLTIVGVVIAVAVNSYAERDENGRIVESGWMFADDLRVGDCTGEESEGDSVWKVEGVPCDEPHLGEVYAIVELSGESFPSEDRMDAACEERMRTDFPEAWDDEEVFLSWISPSESGWDAGDHELVCYAVTEEPRTGSIAE